MEILNSGSFVPLDNREKIDQLIFTARTLATEASRAEGFQNSGQTNHQLGLEMWKGAEYVCRAHEEANIRNLFLGKFLERLREIEKERVVHAKAAVASAPSAVTAPAVRPSPAPVSVQEPPPQTVPEQPPQGAAQDEYLGVVPTDDQSGCDRPSYADECVPEFEAEIAAMNNGTGPGDLVNLPTEKSDEDKPLNSADSGESRAKEIAEIDKSESDTPSKKDEKDPSDVVQQEIEPETEEPVESQQIESIVLAEKEPYNLEACTITAVIQVLPETSGKRKCVVSLRTHDFAPMVAVSESDSAEVIQHISVALGDVLARYRSDLPAKAAEKLKKEKPAAKKQSQTGSKTAKTTTVQSKAATKSEATADDPSQNAETDQNQQGLFAS
ncbi:MAG: hypothetical protein KF762_06955 [Acidobacteria bacterium]|nr:hypothetical protein [Acidobacteriota bacterium]